MVTSGSTKEEIQIKVNTWFCPINPISQTLEYYLNQRKKHG